MIFGLYSEILVFLHRNKQGYDGAKILILSHLTNFSKSKKNINKILKIKYIDKDLVKYSEN